MSADDDDLAELTASCRSAVDDLLTACQSADSPEACAAIWLQLEAIYDDARNARDEAGEWTAKVMDSARQHRTEVAGTRIVVKRRTASVRWPRKSELLEDVVKLVPANGKLNTDTGEVEPERWTTLRLLQECVSVGGGLQRMKNYGLDPDDYRTVEQREPTVEIEHL